MDLATEAVIAGVRDLQRAGKIPADVDLSHLDEETSLAALGLDSLTRLTLLAQLEDRFDTLLHEGGLASVRTIGDLARLTLSSLPSAS